MSINQQERCIACNAVLTEEQVNALPNATLHGEDAHVCDDCTTGDYDVCEHDGVTIAHINEFYEVFAVTQHFPYRRSFFVCGDNIENYTRTIDGEYWRDEDCLELGCGGYIDRNSYEDGDYGYCNHTGDLYHTDDLYYCEWDEEYYSSTSYFPENPDDEDDDYYNPYLINEHNYRPQAVFHTTPSESENDTVGLEIEMDGKSYTIDSSDRHDVAKYWLDTLGTLVYHKKDGSLTRGGFEAVTHPVTYGYLKENRDKIKTCLDYSISKGFRAADTETCGLHVHISRKSFKSQKAQDNFIFLFERFYNQVLKFSRRTEYSMQRWAERYGIYSVRDNNEDFSNKLRNAHRDKYRIVNTLHSATLEVRAFKGTLNVDTLFATVQFMLVMRDLANQNNNVVNNLTWQSVVKLAKVKNYTELLAYFEKRELLNEQTQRVVYKQRRVVGRAVSLGDKLYVVSNNPNCRHYFGNLPMLVKVTDLLYSESNRFVVEPVSRQDVDNLIVETIGRSSQFVLYNDLAFVDDFEGNQNHIDLVNRLSDYVIETN
jgi:hypothetical protein